jgi:cobalamin biosynthesis protein CobW
VDNAEFAALRDAIQGQMRLGAKLVRAAHGRLDPAVLLGLEAASEDDLDSRPSHHDGDNGEHDHDDFESFVLGFGPVADIDAFESRLAAAVRDHGILRIKGFLDRPGRDRREAIQGVGPRLERYFDRDWRPGEARQSQLVVIGFSGLDQASIRSAILG